MFLSHHLHLAAAVVVEDSAASAEGLAAVVSVADLEAEDLEDQVVVGSEDLVAEGKAAVDLVAPAEAQAALVKE